jgi:hypothetical protein
MFVLANQDDPILKILIIFQYKKAQIYIFTKTEKINIKNRTDNNTKIQFYLN